MRFDRAFVQSTLTNACVLFDNFPEDVTIAVDTRLIEPGQLFVALCGERVDGHDFVAKAIRSGAGGVIISADKQGCLDALTQEELARIGVVVVPDPLTALQHLARAWRSQFNIPVIAIAGSAGKTTTREMVVHIVNAAGLSCVSTQKNYNSLVGLPMSVLTMRAHHEVAVFEVGLGERGEMAILADIVQPTIGVITTIGHGHTAGLGDVDQVAQEKLQLFSRCADSCIGIVNGDIPQLANHTYAHPIITFGLGERNDFRIVRLTPDNGGMTCLLKLVDREARVRFDTYHTGNACNALAVCAVALCLGIDEQAAIDALLTTPTVPGRFEKLALRGKSGYIINDAYNANPESVLVSLEAFEHIPATEKKVVVLGDMLELGDHSEAQHRRIGCFLDGLSTIDMLVLVGSEIQATRDAISGGLEVHWVATVDQAQEIIENIDATIPLAILVKASQGMGFAQLVTALVDPQLP